MRFLILATLQRGIIDPPEELVRENWLAAEQQYCADRAADIERERIRTGSFKPASAHWECRRAS